MDLTRRGLIGRALAGGAALMARPGLAFAGPAGEAVFEMRLPAGRGSPSAGAASAARWTSAPARAPRRFELLGVEWTGGGDPAIQVRARSAGGRWSDWLDVPLAHGHGPDGSPARLTDPVWTGPARVFQLRASRPLERARIVFVDSGTAPVAAAAARYADSGLDAGPGQPRIIARSTWANAACRPREGWVYGSVDLAFVHHTVNANWYQRSQSAGMVRSICLFHKYGNGWNDIGYNFCVDRYGQIFEARAGGIDEPIVGAQAGGYNVYSTGVGVLGSFSGAAPTRAAFDSVTQLLAWKLALHGISVPGHVIVEVTSTGGPYSRYRPGSRVRLDRVSGHRDADTTSCPGNGLYRQLPRMRQAIRKLAGNVSSLSAAAAPAGAGAATLTGVLTSAGTPIAGATVDVQQRTSAGPKTIASAITAADGTWSATGPLARAASLRAVYRGDSTHSAVVSPPLQVTVAPAILLMAATQQVVPGAVIEFSGTIAPVKPKLAIVISQQQPDGSFAPVRTIRFGSAEDGSFRRAIGFPAAGHYQVVAQTAADRANAAGASAPVAITVG